jgi:integrase
VEAPVRPTAPSSGESRGKHRLDEMAADIMAVENWVNDLMTLGTPDRVIPARMAKGKLVPEKAVKGIPPRPASKKTKIHFKAFLHRLFEYAIKWGHLTLQRNPIALVEIEGRAKRVRIPHLLTGKQYRGLTTDPELCRHVRTMIVIAMLTGLRASEILGLRWEVIDFERMVFKVVRSYVGAEDNDTKTEGSAQELPIHEDLAQLLTEWREEQTVDGVHTPVNGWLFGNIITGRPFWRDSLHRDHLIPAGKRAGIPNLGWHDFRHTYRAMMDEEKLTLEEQRALMRHDDIRTTLGYGGKTKAETVRGANAKGVEMLRKRA